MEVIELVVEEPAVTELFPELLSAKSNALLRINDALAIVLGLYPLMKALAFTVALLARVIAPV